MYAETQGPDDETHNPRAERGDKLHSSRTHSALFAQRKAFGFGKPS